MKVIYCDLCSLPIKSRKFIIGIAEFAISPFESDEDDEVSSAIKALYPKITKPTHYAEKEICDHCHKILLEIFEHRFNNKCKEAENLRKQFELPAKLNLKDRSIKDKFRKKKK